MNEENKTLNFMLLEALTNKAFLLEASGDKRGALRYAAKAYVLTESYLLILKSHSDKLFESIKLLNEDLKEK